MQVTLSAGVAGTDRTRIFDLAPQFTNAADRAVYAAKTAGRNCVRVFKPRVQDSAKSAGTVPVGAKA